MRADIIKTVYEEAKSLVSGTIKPGYADKGSLEDREKELVRKLDEDGIVLIEDFYDVEKCQALIAEIDRLLDTYAGKLWKDKEDADNRIYFSNLSSSLIQAYYEDESIMRLIKAYEDAEQHNGFTLAGKITFKEGNLGSGGGWHRDFVKRKQTKSIIYLTDTSEQQGPFQFLLGSHKFGSILKFQNNYDFHFNQFRFTEEQIDQVVSDNPSSLLTVTGKAGSLVIADTRGIHRGKPIAQGQRYALTNYLWFNAQIPPHIRKLNPFA